MLPAPHLALVSLDQENSLALVAGHTMNARSSEVETVGSGQVDCSLRRVVGRERELQEVGTGSTRAEYSDLDDWDHHLVLLDPANGIGHSLTY